MQSDPPDRRLEPRRAHDAISAEVRRVARGWAIAALGVVILIGVVSLVSGAYDTRAKARAQSVGGLVRAAGRLGAVTQREAADRLAWEVSRTPSAAQTLVSDHAALAAAVTRARRAARADGGPAGAALVAAADAAAAWEAGLLQPGRFVTPPAPHVDVRAVAVQRRITTVRTALTPEMRTATAGAADAAWWAAAARLGVTLAGLAVVLAGGGMLLLKAWRLAGDADARRERQTRWSEQIESILEWSSRAKAATTRSQLIGYAHMAPRDAIGAACLSVAEGAPPTHRSHGLGRLSVPVDSAGEGLHASVCFAPGRGDELDHHAVDLMLGHLAALWRTVLRQEDLERAAGHDALTGLPNRRTFEAELRRRVGLSKRRGLGFTLAMVDLDHFKAVNDSFGHPEGDAVLRRAGEAIRTVLRGSDRIFRLGGEEFALVLETTDQAGVEDVLQRAREAVRALAVEPDEGRRLSASIGWAVFSGDAPDRTELVERADAALYRAKTTGRDRVVAAA